MQQGRTGFKMACNGKSRGQQPFQHVVPVWHFLVNECALSKNIFKIKMNYDTVTKNISRRPGIALLPYSPQSCINILMFFWLLYLQHGLTNYMSHFKTQFSETHSKTYLHCEKCKRREYMRMLQISTSISLRNVQLCNTMWRWAYRPHTRNNILNIFFTHHIGLKTIDWSHFWTLLSVTNLNIFELGGNDQNRIKCKKNR